MTRITRGMATLAALCLGLGTASLAGAGEKQTMSGQVTGKEGTRIMIQSATGEQLSVRTNDDTTIRGPQGDLGMTDIDRGDRVQVTAMQDPQGEHVATEIRVESSAGMAPGTTGTGTGTGTGTSPEHGKDPRQLMPTENPQKGAPGEME